MSDKEITLVGFESRLHESLVQLCKSEHFLSSDFLSSPDIDEKWNEMIYQYVADASEQVVEYPTVAMAWASYLGMAIAHGWDEDWEKCKGQEYASYYGERGFDDMDDHIVRDILHLPLNGKEAQNIESIVRRCSEVAISMIYHEKAEPQSSTALLLFSKAVKEMYRIGAAIELHRLGYKLKAVDFR